MTLQDDIARILEVDYKPGFAGRTAHTIAAGLERDYHLVKLDELPEVTEHGNGCLIVNQSGKHFTQAMSLVDAKERALRYVALFRHQAARESEAATLARRRDELAREYSPSSLGYDDLGGTGQALINALAAAEDEIARLKATT